MLALLALFLPNAHALPELQDGSPSAQPVVVLDPVEAPFTYHELEGTLRHDSGYCSFTLERSATQAAAACYQSGTHQAAMEAEMIEHGVARGLPGVTGSCP